MRVPPRALRRLLLPISLVVLVGLALLALLGLLIGLVTAPFDRRRRTLRLAAFALSYCVVDGATVLACSWLSVRYIRHRRQSRPEWRAAHDGLLAWALGSILGAARRYVGFRVEIDPRSQPALLDQSAPVLVLARHGGLGDSFALVHLLLTTYRRRVRIVLKEVLQLDPALDLVLNRVGCYFLPSSGQRAHDLVTPLEALARSLAPGEALLVFPEGGNWTPGRRHRAISRLRRDGKREAARAADLMEHVLPPRPNGVLACLEAQAGLAVMVAAHAGLDRLIRAGQVWRHLPLTTPMTVRLWPAAPVPDGDEARLAWLTTEWAVVDEWIDRYEEGVGSPARVPGRPS